MSEQACTCDELQAAERKVVALGQVVARLRVALEKGAATDATKPAVHPHSIARAALDHDEWVGRKSLMERGMEP